MTSLLIVSDHAMVRRGLRGMLGEDFRNAFFSEATTADQGIAWLSRRSFNAVILHLGSPGTGHFLERIRNRFDVPVLIISRHAEPQSASRSLSQGASGYISQAASRVELAKALKTVLGRGQYVSESLKKKPKTHVASSAHHDLSAREHATLIALATGKRQSEIAGELNLSIKTVSTYKTRVLNKLGIDSLAGLVRYVIENNIR